MAKSTATLTDNETGKSYEMPIIHGTIGPRLVDIRKMYGESGMFTYDPGFTSTGSCGSTITYIDGDEGVLLYRGYNIAELAEMSDFMEVCYLLMKGDLPNKAQKEKFTRDITLHTMVHEQISQFYRGFRRDAHPMADENPSSLRCSTQSMGRRGRRRMSDLAVSWRGWRPVRIAVVMSGASQGRRRME